MNANVIRAIFKRNFVSYFSNPTGYVFICVFVLLSSFAAFWPNEFFNANLANLDQLNKYLPFIMLVFIPALGVGLVLDEWYHGFELPGKLKMSVSGCVLNCAESWVSDIGLTGYEEEWTLTVGGNVGARPRIGKELTKGLTSDQALTMVERILHYYKTNAKKGERLGMLIDRIGLDALKAVVC